MGAARRLLATSLLLLAASHTAARPLHDPTVPFLQLSGSMHRRLLGAAGPSGLSTPAVFHALAPARAAAASAATANVLGPALAPDAEPAQQQQQPPPNYGEHLSRASAAGSTRRMWRQPCRGARGGGRLRACVSTVQNGLRGTHDMFFSAGFSFNSNFAFVGGESSATVCKACPPFQVASRHIWQANTKLVHGS